MRTSTSPPSERAASRLRRALSRQRPAPERRRTLLDADQQAAFERDGFVVVDVIDAATVGELHRRYEALEHHRHTEYPWVDGFETTMHDPRYEARAQVLRDAEEVLQPAIDAVLDRYRIMFANYVVKRPHGDAVPIHADWTFLDESAFSSVTVRFPFEDCSVELANGPLGMVAGSHRRVDFVRVANIPTFERCEELSADLDHVVPSLTAGQAIVMDNRVVHFSPPNHTDRTRVALGLVMGPVEAPMHHHWQHEDGRVLRFEVDPEFYLDYAIGQPEGTRGIARVTEVPADATR